jgi:hypothetical protein
MHSTTPLESASDGVLCYTNKMHIYPKHDDLIEIAKDILVVPNYFSKEEIKVFMDIAENPSADWSWLNDDENNQHSKFWVDKHLPVGLKRYKKNIEDLFENKYWVPNPNRISRYLVGDFITEHRDKQLPIGEKAADGWGVLIYLNDNYDGGELCYSEFNIEYKPKAGDLVMHNSGYLHYSKPVTAGKKYFMTTYTYPVEMRPN